MGFLKYAGNMGLRSVAVDGVGTREGSGRREQAEDGIWVLRYGEGKEDGENRILAGGAAR